MSSKSGAIDRWRKYFRGADGDIFDILEYAILVAASDCPKEFRIRRDEIAQKLFACRLVRCVDCDSVTLAKPADDGDGASGRCHVIESKVTSSIDDNVRNRISNDGASGRCHVIESKVTSSIDDNVRNRISNYSYDEAEALTKEIEEESQIIGEVLRIKVIVENPDESDASLFESLRKLQLMELSIDILQATEIGRAVSRLKKHGSKQIRILAKALVFCWKKMVDAWILATNTAAGDSQDSVNPSMVDDEEGLPSPPLDEGAFLATQIIELSQFFDGMDDDGNPRNGGDPGKNRQCNRKSDERNHPNSKPNASNEHAAREERGVARKEESIVIKRPAKVTNAATPLSNSGPGRPTELTRKDGSLVRNAQSKVTNNHSPSSNSGPGGAPSASADNKLVDKPKLHQSSDPKRTALGTLLDKSKCSDDMPFTTKLEAAKRKLQEGYQRAENAKKQRTIQVVDLHDLPKQGLKAGHPTTKPGFHNRNWGNRRP